MGEIGSNIFTAHILLFIAISFFHISSGTVKVNVYQITSSACFYERLNTLLYIHTNKLNMC